MYVERPSTIQATIVWQRLADQAARIVPDGCTDLIWSGEELLVAGPDTRAYVADATPDRQLTALRFGPGIGAAVFGIPISELRDQRVELDQLLPAAEVRDLADQIAAADDPGAALEAAIRDRMRSPSPLMLAVADLLGQDRPVAVVADAVGLSARQLQRRSMEAFGYGPKTLARILRFQRAARLARSGTPLAAVAATAGFSDQSHLSRDVRQLAGVTLTELVTT